jgi:hypothetical protein
MAEIHDSASTTNGGNGRPKAQRVDFHAVLHRAAILLCTIDDCEAMARSMFEIVSQRFPDVIALHRPNEGEALKTIKHAAYGPLGGPPSMESWSALAIVALDCVGILDALPDGERFVRWPEPLPVAIEEGLRAWDELRALRLRRKDAHRDGEPTEDLDREIGAWVDELIERQHGRRDRQANG